MSIVSAIMVPHPPLIISDIGRGKEKEISNTIDAYNKACELIKNSNPDTIIIISPHTEYYNDYFHISSHHKASGNFSRFGCPKVNFSIEYDTEFVEYLSKSNRLCGTEGERNAELDHGTMVPLYFLKKHITDVKYIRIGLSNLPLEEHYYLGKCIKEISEKLNRKVAIVASGDLSHKLLESGPYGYSKYGEIYDKKIMNTMKNANFDDLLTYDKELLKESANCGHESFTIMAGCFDKMNVKSEMLSYEGPFGVGYGICTYLPNGTNNSRNYVDNYLIEKDKKMKNIRNNESEYVKLARNTIETYVKSGKIINIPENTSKELLNNKKAVFVTLHKFDSLRGCIGTIIPSYNSIAEEIIHNAIKACSEDPRFSRLEIDELEDIVYSVDLLSDIEPIDSKDKLDVKKYGVIVTNNYRRGLLLPNIDGIDTVDSQIEIAKEKARIRKEEDVKLERFEVIRYY